MFVLLVSVKLTAQSDKVFHTYIYNDEFKVYMDINLYENNVIVPHQELFGDTRLLRSQARPTQMANHVCQD